MPNPITTGEELEKQLREQLKPYADLMAEHNNAGNTPEQIKELQEQELEDLCQLFKILQPQVQPLFNNKGEES